MCTSVFVHWHCGQAEVENGPFFKQQLVNPYRRGNQRFFILFTASQRLASTPSPMTSSVIASRATLDSIVKGEYPFADLCTIIATNLSVVDIIVVVIILCQRQRIWHCTWHKNSPFGSWLFVKVCSCRYCWRRGIVIGTKWTLWPHHFPCLHCHLQLFFPVSWFVDLVFHCARFSQD